MRYFFIYSGRFYLFIDTSMTDETTPISQNGKRNRQSFWDFVNSIEALWDEYFIQKAPFHIPAHIKEFLVKAAPYVVAIILLLTLPAILAVIGLWSMFSVINPYYWPLVVLSTAFAIAVFALEVIAIKPLSKREIRGWKYMFYAQILWFIAGVLGWWVLWAIIGWLIGFYVLFQLKSYYK